MGWFFFFAGKVLYQGLFGPLCKTLKQTHLAKKSMKTILERIHDQRKDTASHPEVGEGT